MNTALLQAIDKDNHAALDLLISESAEVVGWFSSFAQGAMAIFVDKYLSSDGKVKLEGIDIGSLPKASDIMIPYYFRISMAHGDAPLN